MLQSLIMEDFDAISIPALKPKLNELTKARGHIRSKITKVCNKIDQEALSFSAQQKLMHINKCKSLLDEIKICDSDLFSISVKLNHTEEQLEQRSNDDEFYTDSIRSALAQLEIIGIVPATSLPNGGGGSTDRAQVSSGRVKLPPIALPQFGNNKGENLVKFFRSFETIISRHNLASHEKFVFLQQQLSNAPKLLVDSLDIDNQSYECAKLLLQQAFDQTEQSKHDVIKTLANLKLQSNGDPYKFIGEMRTVISGVQSLNITTDDFITHFVWSGLNTEFQSHLTNITNKCKPSLDDINTNIFEATDRYVKQLNEAKECRVDKFKQIGSKPMRHDSNVNAVAVKNGKTMVYCCLCSSDKIKSDHLLRDCPVYSTPKKKFDKLRSIKACTKCSFANHETFSCKFVFKTNCRFCNGQHMSYLCLKSSKPQNASNIMTDFLELDNESNVMTNNLSFIEASQLSANNTMILPTFTAGLITEDQSNYPVRIFKDSGCQLTFVCSALAESMQLPIINDKVPLTIHGFNASKNIITKSVKINLKVGSNVFTHTAICVDGIRTKFSVEGVGQIVESFESSGFKMADVNLTKTCSGIVENIDLILGTDADHILSMTYTTFGDPAKINDLSCYIDTPIGVVLSGNRDKMLKNLKYICGKNSTSTETSSNSCFSNLMQVKNITSTTLNDVDDEVESFSTDISLETQINKLCFGNDNDMLFCNNVHDLKSITSDEGLRDQCNKTLNVCDEEDEVSDTETNVKVIEFVLNNTKFDKDGRLTMPLSWNNKNSHLLSQNYFLARKLLESNLEKLLKNPDKLKMYNDVFQEQKDLQIIEKIDNLDRFLLEHPEASFLPHMGIYRLSNETTKCRIVFLSNLFEKKNHGISHNMAMLPGPNLNHKIATAVLFHRFDRYMLTFDIQKAFLNIKLYECDQNRLCFLWYRNIELNDYTIVGYKNVRLSFGLRCSPAILMLGLYKILMLEKSGDQKLDEMKRSIYNTIYMDNGSFSCNTEQEIIEAYAMLGKIFPPHKLNLQQHCTNVISCQKTIDGDQGSDTPASVKLFGMLWSRTDDTLTPHKLNLDKTSSTKRQILSSINSIYDIYNVYAPVLLRSKLFLQKILTDNSLKWDTPLPSPLQNEWNNIVRQANNTPQIYIPRCVGERSSTYSLIAFTDASSEAYGTVIYIKDLVTNRVSFLMAKNRLVSTTKSKKTIPSLEFQAITFGVETLYKIHQSLSGETVVIPVNISSLVLFTDSTACLHWIRKHSVKFEKLQSLSVFVKNRLRIINEICCKVPMTFHHVAGEINPSDNVTRHAGHKALLRCNYYEGPDFLSGSDMDFMGDLSVTLPNPVCKLEDEVPTEIGAPLISSSYSVSRDYDAPSHLVPLNKFSNFDFLTKVVANVLRFVDILKRKVRSKANLNVGNDVPSSDFHRNAISHIISVEQKIAYPQVFQYFESRTAVIRDIPDLVTKFNLYRDKFSVLRIKSKFAYDVALNPILLPQSSVLTQMIIQSVHNKMSHSGIYAVIRELRKNFWIEKAFSAVKKTVRGCITCRKIHERPIKTNQNSYREFRVDPPRKPFRSIFLDYIGPFSIELEGKKSKVWLLAITCLWSRAVNIKICRDFSVDEFLRGIQLHCFEYGLFEQCISDLGSQIQAGANILRTFLADFETKRFLESNGIKELTFQHYAKGNSSLGSLIETCVKQIKYLIYKTVKTTILNFFDFDYLISKTVHMINKRPIAFRENLRSLPPDQVPTCVTPELLLRGFDCTSVNMIPQLQAIEEEYNPNRGSPDDINQNYVKLRNVRERLIDLYHSDFLANLIYQAVDKPSRYKPVPHNHIKPGDVVLLVDKYLKRYYYPMGRVLSVEENSLGEITAARVRKGNTHEVVYRHVTSLILLLSGENFEPETVVIPPPPSLGIPLEQRKPRKAAKKCLQKLAKLGEAHLI